MTITKPKCHINHFFVITFSSLMPFYEQNTILFSQNNNLLNHVANCEIFLKNILHAKYFAKYNKP